MPFKRRVVAMCSIFDLFARADAADEMLLTFSSVTMVRIVHFIVVY